MDSDKFMTYAFLAAIVVVVAGGRLLLQWHQKKVDAAVVLTEADFERSEFKIRPIIVLMYCGIGLVVAVGASYSAIFGRHLNWIGGVLISLAGLAGLGYGLYIKDDRIVFRDWVVSFVRRGKPQWQTSIGEIDCVTKQLRNGRLTHLELETSKGDYDVDFRKYVKGNKLKVMLLDPKRALKQAADAA